MTTIRKPMIHSLSYLSQRDPQLAQVIAQVTLSPLPPPLDPYLTLLKTIVSQQLSSQVAEKIWQKLRLYLGSELTPAAILSSAEGLRTLGLSRQKISYLRAIASYAQQQELTLSTLSPLTDQEIIQRLTRIHGVGHWTVQIFLMFCLQRPDVFAVEDLALQQAMQKLYDLPDQRGKGFKQQLQILAAHWTPYRTIACRYLWAWRNQSKKGT